MHVPTLYLVLGSFSLLAAAALAVESYRTRRSILSFWVGAYVASTCVGAGNLLLFGMNEHLAVILPPAFAMLALALMHAGVCRFCGQRTSLLAYAPLVVWLGLGLAHWSTMPLEASYFERRLVSCSIFVAQSLVIAALLLRLPGPRSWPAIPLAAVFLIHALAFGVRLLQLSPVFGPNEAAMTDPWLFVMMFEGILFVPATAYLFVLMMRENAERRLRAEARIDPLTGLANRAAFRAGVERALRSGAEVTLVLIDLDHFKAINDTFGHATGDEVLRIFARQMELHLRPGEHTARWGGEEFACAVLAERTETTVARMEQLSSAFTHAVAARLALERDVTLSAGLAAGARVQFDALIGSADAALYRAKRSGRSRIAVAEPGQNWKSEPAQDRLARQSEGTPVDAGRSTA